MKPSFHGINISKYIWCSIVNIFESINKSIAIVGLAWSPLSFFIDIFLNDIHA